MSVSPKFELSFFTIRLKLILIISGILLLSVTGIIYIASYFFKNDTEIRIEEYNKKLSEVIGIKVRTDIDSTIEKMKILARSTEPSKNGKVSLGNQFFNEDSNLILFGIYSKKEQDLIPKVFFLNKNFQKENSVEDSEILNLVNKNKEEFFPSFQTESMISNLSPGFKTPVIGISIPHKNTYDEKSILICIFKVEKIINAFKTTGYTSSYFVNGKGMVLAHPDQKILLSGTDLKESPIVKAMLTSTIDNGLKKNYEEINKEGKRFIGSFKQIGFAGAGVISAADESIAFEEVYNIQRRNTYILLITFFSSILIIFLFATRFTESILNLVKGTEEIEQGNYHINLKPVANDEVGLLTNSFVKMGTGLAEREKVKDALGRFVNKEVAEMVLKGELKLGGERKNCAIFFSDIRSFTAISEKLEPEEVVEFLNAYMTEMVKCVNDSHGTVDKFIGDAVMATWGAAFSRGNDAENAVNGALQMRKVLLKFNLGRGGDKKPIIKIGSGLNFGPVVAGQIGSTDKMEYTVIGDAVNLASRIESLNKPFGTDILISSDLYQEVEGIFKVEKMKSIKVKGKTEPQIIYAVIGRNDDPECLKNLEEVRKLVGIEKPKESNDSDEEKEVKYEILE